MIYKNKSFINLILNCKFTYLIFNLYFWFIFGLFFYNLIDCVEIISGIFVLDAASLAPSAFAASSSSEFIGIIILMAGGFYILYFII